MNLHTNRVIIIMAGLLAWSLAMPSRASDEVSVDQSTVIGMIEDIDGGRGSLTVKTFEKSMTFHVAKDATIVTTNSPAATLYELSPGNQVEVSYDQMLTAHRITQIAAAAAKPAPPR